MPIQRSRPELSSDVTPDRPPIWVNGRQRPAFNWRAYGAYSLIVTRDGLGPVMARVADATAGLQGRISAGAYPINTARLGRAADYLPTRAGIATTIGGVAGVIKAAGQIVIPPPVVPESLEAYDVLWRSRPVPSSGRLRGVDLDQAQSDPALDALRAETPLRPRKPMRLVVANPTADLAPQPAPVLHLAEAPAPAPSPPSPPQVPPPDQDTLFATRDLMQASAPVEPGSTTLAPSAPPVPPQTQQSRAKGPRSRRPLPGWVKAGLGHLRTATAFVLALSLTLIALPYGLVKAGIAHLEGRDLLDLVEDR